jgi:hypothetical protein
MMRALTRSRSADFHRATMLRLTIAALLLWGFWGPLHPVRSVTADLLSTTADQLRR